MIEKSKKITIKYKPNLISLPGFDTQDLGYKIGAYIDSNTRETARAFTPDQEKKWLPSVLGVSADHVNWFNLTKNYWANISQRVPPDGLELEIGLKYPTEEDAKLKTNGIPINIGQYIIYKHCKNYRKVANSLEDSYKSNKIWFYIDDPEIEAKAQLNSLEQQHAAFEALIKIKNNIEVSRMVVSVMFDTLKLEVLPDIMTPTELLLALNKAAINHGTEFLKVVEDKDLTFRAFLFNCLLKGHLDRIPATEIITYNRDGEDKTLGQSYKQAIEYLKSENGKHLLNKLEALAQYSPFRHDIAKENQFKQTEEVKK